MFDDITMDGVLSEEDGEQSLPAAQLDGEVFFPGEKRSVENGGVEGDLDERPNKRPKTGPGTGATLKRVAEIVIVLSTVAKIRAGKKPTEAEIWLMTEARAKLVELCEGLAPNNIVAREAIEVIIEDLELDGKVKDQILGFSGPKLTITDRILQNKKKMEESRKYTPQSSAYASHSLEVNINMAPKIQGSSNTIQIVPSEKPNHATLTSGSISASSPQGQVSATAPTTRQHHLPTSVVKASSVSCGLSSGHLARDSSLSTLPRVERPQFKMDGGPNGSTYAFQGQVHSSENHQMMHAEKNKLPNHTSVRVEGTVEMGMPQGTPAPSRDQSFRKFSFQTTPGNFPNVHPPLHAMNSIQAPSLFNNHNEIARVVQKLLQPKKPDQPTWIPPSRDYMNKALTCHLCQLTINEMDTVLICDACEKGYHIKCMQSMNQRGIPRGEWHCSRCLALSDGKPLPPKYGRVMRSNTPAKVPSCSASVQSSWEKKVGSIDPSVNQQNITAKRTSDLQLQCPSHTFGKEGNNIGPPSDSQNPSAREIQTDNFSSNPSPGKMQTCNISPNPNAGELKLSEFISNPNAEDFQIDNFTLSVNNMDEKLFLGSSPNTTVNSLGEASSPHGASSERSQDTENPGSSTCKDESLELKAIPLTNEITNNKSDDFQSSHDPLVDDQSGPTNSTEVPSGKFQENNSHNATSKNPDKSHLGENSECKLRYDIKRDNQNGAEKNAADSSDTSIGVKEHPGHSLYGLHDVEWIGDVVRDFDGKYFYTTCCVDGATYKIQDHALFRSSHDKLTPSKLQTMWEDSKTGLKWVIVNSCYFPGDLPENVGRPSPPESNEVYESNHNSSIMAGLIQGPCEVLHPTKFKEESERRSHSKLKHDSGLRPIFLCRWLYDEFKGSFQPVFS